MITPPEPETGEVETAPGEEFVECHRCGAATPAENLNCIYCGGRLPLAVGFLSSLAGGWKGRIGIILAVLVLAAFLLWIM